MSTDVINTASETTAIAEVPAVAAEPKKAPKPKAKKPGLKPGKGAKVLNAAFKAAGINGKGKAKAGKGKKDTAKFAPKSKPMPNGKSVHAEEPVREPKWNERRIALVKAMRALKATDAKTAVKAEDIAAKMGTVEGIKMPDRVDLVKIILDVYRTAELVHNGFAKSVRKEGERGLSYYLTAKGAKTTFPVKEPKAAAKE